MAFGISKQELIEWKKKAAKGEIAIITHFWLDPRFPECDTVTKAACSNIETLIEWGKKYGLKKEWIHQRVDVPHFDLLGEKQEEVLRKEGYHQQLERFFM